VLHAREQRLHAVIITLAERIKLMVVAAAAVDGQAKECCPGCGEYVVQIVHALLQHPFHRLIADDVMGAANQEPRGGLR
jgi:hypothetical protein